MDRQISFILNDEAVETALPPGTVVLDFLRRDRRLSGTKEGCREGDCGACMVLVGELDASAASERPHLRYRAVNSCLLPLGDLAGRHLVSIEGINPGAGPGPSDLRAASTRALPLTPVQSRMVAQGAIQCGFCTPGFVVSLTGYLLSSRGFSLEGAVEAVAGNICRCTGYASIRRAIVDLLAQLEREGLPGGGEGAGGARGAEGFGASGSDPARLQRLVDLGVVPAYFLDIPTRLEELSRSARPARAAGQGTLVAGGTDLFVQKPEELLEAKVSFLSDSPDLKGWRLERDTLYLGAGLSMEEVRDIPVLAERLPGLEEALRLVASAPVRRRATLGGNLVNASPIGDFTIILLALGATVGLRELGNGRSGRTIALRDFYKGYKRLDRKAAEVLSWISLPLSPQGFFSFEKVSRRRHLDIASVNSAAWIHAEGDRIEEARLSAGGVAPIPLYLSRASASLSGRRLDSNGVALALQTAQEEIAPIDDVRGSAQYKRLLLRQLLLAHLFKAFPRALDPEDWL